MVSTYFQHEEEIPVLHNEDKAAFQGKSVGHCYLLLKYYFWKSTTDQDGVTGWLVITIKNEVID
jgi:hypothetical protein